MKITGNEPSMPNMVNHYSENLAQKITEGGLTIRQHFAMAAMHGFLSSPNLCTRYDEKPYSEIVAETSVKFADALINELNKSEL